MNSTILNKNKAYYLNGNYLVFYDYGDRQFKRCLRIGEDFEAEFPDSIDLKITNKCSHGCPYCHENSVSDGASFNLDHTIEILKQLPKYPIEIAIGGGNVLDIPNETMKLINWCNDYGFKTRITVNHKDIKKFCHKIPKNKKETIEITARGEGMILEIGTKVGGVGISLDPNLLPETDELIGRSTILVEKLFGENELNDNTISSCLRGKNIVFHIIAGLFPIDKLKMILDKEYIKSLGNLLILGYKQFGRAANTELPESLPEFEKVIKEFIINSRNDYMSVFNIAFDNLALKQLHMKEFITEDDWDHLYLGKEGSCSMYIDAVNETYAKSSTSIERVSWKDVRLLDYFKSLRNENNN